MNADIVVVGFGAAGSSAALRGAELGVDVLVLEKQERDAHTPNTRMSGGLIMGANDAEKAGRYLTRCAGGMIPDDVCFAWAERALMLRGWLERECEGLHLSAFGGAEHPQFDGADGIEVYQLGETRSDAAESELHVAAAGGAGNVRSGRVGRDLFAALEQAVHAKRSVTVEYGAPVERLLVEDGKVTGVVVSDGRKVRARHGVLLACGGYEYDDELKLNYLKASPVYFYGNPGNTGDGIRMAQAVGADLWHMNQMIGRAIGHFEREDGTAVNIGVYIGPPPYLITDRYGRRYANEYPQALMEHAFYYEMIGFDSDACEYPRIPSYWFFDEQRRLAAPLVSTTAGAVGVGLVEWSTDNSAEIERGWIHRGESIEEAARAAGVLDPEGAASTVAAFNETCRRGSDPRGRPAETLVPLDSPPYYCVPLYPGGSNTCGGPRRDRCGRVIDVYGEPIEGLYAAGELGESVGLLYPSNGANLSEAFCFGQLAVERMLRQQPT